MKKLSAGVAMTATLMMAVSFAQAQAIVEFDLQAEGENSVEVLSSADNGFMPSVTVDVYVDTNQPLHALKFNFNVSPPDNTHGYLWQYAGLPAWGPMAYEFNDGDTYPIVVGEVYNGQAHNMVLLGDDPATAETDETPSYEEFFGQWGDTTIGRKLLASYTFQATEPLNPPRSFQFTIGDIGNGFSYTTSDFNSGTPEESIPLTVDIVSYLTVKPDHDKDNDVDQSDFGYLQACLGSNPVSKPSCAWADFNSDQLINANDRAIWQNCFSGAGVPPVLGCDE